ncbi:MAG: hypothetical protein EB060_01735 [Proteobacteria bacterium]|nr:hypothetical protein [Pseudomonadota bacterium]
MQSDITENTDQKHKPWQFKPGQSGNPSGKPKGSRHKTTMAVQALLEGEAEAISRKAIELALMGDLTAIRLVLERVLPPRKDAPVLLDITKPTSLQEVTQTIADVVDAVAGGEITPGEGQAVVNIIDNLRKAIETTELEQRITKLEEQVK